MKCKFCGKKILRGSFCSPEHEGFYGDKYLVGAVQKSSQTISQEIDEEWISERLDHIYEVLGEVLEKFRDYADKAREQKKG